MKKALNILICLLMIGCTYQTEKKVQTALTEAAAEEVQLKFVELSKKHTGFWVNEQYYKALIETHSTKKAGEMGVDDFYKISDDNSIMRMNIHEGGADNIILMTSKDVGQIFSSDTTESYFEVEFTDGLMIV